MPTIKVIALVMALSGGLLALWRAQPETNWREMPAIAAVTVGADGGLVVRGSFPSDCRAQLQAEIFSFPHNLDVQLFRQRSSRLACAWRSQTFTYALTSEPGENPPYLLINGDAWKRDQDQNSRDYRPLMLHPAHIEHASLQHSQAGELLLALRGLQAIGCQLPELYSLRSIDGQLAIGVFNALPSDVACAAMLLDVRETVSLPATKLPEPALLMVNGFVITDVETQDVSEHDKVLTNIINVDARVMESYPMRVSLDVQGEHPDGCDLPVKVAQSRQGKTITVEIYREVPADMFCPMILRPYRGDILLDGSFESGRYIIKVNSHSQTLEL